jgi:hypothetical protein
MYWFYPIKSLCAIWIYLMRFALAQHFHRRFECCSTEKVRWQSHKTKRSKQVKNQKVDKEWATFTHTHTHTHTHIYRGADMSLAQPGNKQANVSVTMVWISFGALPCRKNLDDSSRLDVVEITRVPDMLPRLFPSWSGQGLISTTVYIYIYADPPPLFPLSTGNTFQDLPRLREAADNTERYI